MSTTQKQMESMLFNYETTCRTDYRDGQIKPSLATELKTDRPTCYRQRQHSLNFINTLKPWLTNNVPFDLFGKPKTIIATNPRDVQPRYEKEPDLMLEEVKHSRPRLVMSPAVAIDDIKDPRLREALVEEIYTSSAHRAMRESASAFPTNTVRAPFPGVPAVSRPIKLLPLESPYVSPEWRMDSVFWDTAQLRSNCAPCREFWLRRQPPQCSACDLTAEQDARTKRLRQRQVRQ